MNSLLSDMPPQTSSAAHVATPRRVVNVIALAAWFLCLALIARKTVFVRQRRDVDAHLSVDATAAVEIALVAVACLLLISRPQLVNMLRSLRGTAAGWFTLMCGFGLLSSVWSPQPQYTAFQSVEVLSQTLLVLLGIGYCRSFADAEKNILTVCSLCLMLDMAMVIKLNGLTFAPRLWHANAYPACAAMIACYCMAEFFGATGERARRLFWVGMFAIFALALGTSSSSIVSAAVGICLASLLLRGARWPLVALIAILAVGALLAPDTALEILFPGKEGAQVTTMRGRTDMWAEFATYISERPIFGHGFAIGDRLNGGLATNTHNSLLSVALGMGAVGLMLFGATLLILAREAWKTLFTHCPGSAGVTCALVAGLLNCMTMAYLGEDWKTPSLVFVCFLMFHFMIVKRGLPLAMATPRQG
ncbi:MAG: O-antigen ligase family protein [Planctomycetales bacterium]|nr:O-antigen ligase family protein [Planctomycetales bacterium]